MNFQVINRANIHRLKPLVDLKDNLSRELVDSERITGATVRFSPDGKVVVSSGYDSSLHIFDLATFQPVYSKLASFPIAVTEQNPLAIHPTAPVLITNYERRAVIFNYETLSARYVEPGYVGGQWSMPIHPGGHLWAFDNHQGINVADFETDSIQLTLQGHHSQVSGLVFANGGDTLISAGRYISSGRGVDSTVRFWDTASGQERFKLDPDRGLPMGISTSPGNRLVAISYFAGPGGYISIIDLDTYESIFTITDGDRPFDRLVFSEDGLMLATTNWGGNLQLWSVKNRTELWRWNAHSDFGRSNIFAGLSYSKDQSLLITSVRERSLLFFDLQAGKLETSIPLPEVHDVALSADGRMLATGGWNGTQLWAV